MFATSETRSMKIIKKQMKYLQSAQLENQFFHFEQYNCPKFHYFTIFTEHAFYLREKSEMKNPFKTKIKR